MTSEESKQQKISNSKHHQNQKYQRTYFKYLLMNLKIIVLSLKRQEVNHSMYSLFMNQNSHPSYPLYLHTNQLSNTPLTKHLIHYQMSTSPRRNVKTYRNSSHAKRMSSSADRQVLEKPSLPNALPMRLLDIQHQIR